LDLDLIPDFTRDSTPNLITDLNFQGLTLNLMPDFMPNLRHDLKALELIPG
jgi:hypothetical protein